MPAPSTTGKPAQPASLAGTGLLVIALLAVGTVVTPAWADSGFQVSVRVLRADGGAPLLDRVSLPEHARLLASGPEYRTLLLERDHDEAAAYFRQAMPDRGWTLVGERAPDRHRLDQTWSNELGRVTIRLQAPLGTSPLTRVSLHALP